MEHPINDLMSTTLEKIREMIDVNTVIGEPIHAGEDIVVIPVSRMTVGFTSGGSDFVSKNHKPEHKNSFAGGSGAGISIQPISFLVIKGENIRMVPVQAYSTTVDKVVDMVPEMVDKVVDVIQNFTQKEEKTEKGFDEPVQF